ncbi:MAG: hypothetical protein K5798_03580 [Nitrosopumilus sp.]|uniref:hypothetical protein n=1 Tax=Nitrosopumilus sp. TaxID=2024843 RepID=UPI00242B088F|nr:hypothetical protein [Nitrosopumilus sp.]MCV0366333.1 hypothetical protein [Nitrosopumilus sp.]
MGSKTGLEALRHNVYTDAGLSRVLGIIEAYIKGKKVTLNWVYNQIVKGHDISDAKRIIEIFEEHLTSIDSQRYIEVKEKLN